MLLTQHAVIRAATNAHGKRVSMSTTLTAVYPQFPVKVTLSYVVDGQAVEQQGEYVIEQVHEDHCGRQVVRSKVKSVAESDA